MGKFIFTLLILIPGFFLNCQELAINGSAQYGLFYIEENEFFIHGEKEEWSDYSSRIFADSFISYYSPDLFSIVADIEVTGSMDRAPSLNLSQLYINFNLGDFIFYIGKKDKQVGSASWFNVSNRITPKESDYTGNKSSTLGLLDIEWLVSESVQLGMVSWFDNPENWDELNLAPYLSLDLWSLSLSAHLYVEEMENFSLGYSLGTQLGDLQLYLEGLADEEISSIVVGASIPLEDFTISMEYLYQEKGINAGKLEEYYIGLDNRSPEEKLLKNYLAATLSLNRVIIEDLRGRVSLLTSIPEDFNLVDKLSSRLSSSLSYSYSDLLFTAYFEYGIGSEKSEMVKSYANKFTFGFFTTLYY